MDRGPSASPDLTVLYAIYIDCEFECKRSTMPIVIQIWSCSTPMSCTGDDME